MRLLELLGFYDPIDEATDTIKLDGPFIEESYVIRNRSKYAELLNKKFSKCNLNISRDLLILSPDTGFSERDNPRVEIGLSHHIHQLELYYHNNKDYEILAIDHYIILNPLDAEVVKSYINNHLPTKEELKNNRLNA